MKITLTGNQRTRIHKRLFRRPLVIMEVEERVTGCGRMPDTGYFDDIDYRRWRPMRPDDMLAEELRLKKEPYEDTRYISEASTKRRRKPQDPSRYPPSATQEDIELAIDQLCRCAGKWDCNCISCFYQVRSEMWYAHNVKVHG